MLAEHSTKVRPQAPRPSGLLQLGKLKEGAFREAMKMNKIQTIPGRNLQVSLIFTQYYTSILILIRVLTKPQIS